MKVFITVLSFTLISSLSLALEVPVGDFHYTNTQASKTKHVHRLYQQSSAEKNLIETYRANGYLCKRQNSSITDCSKFIDTNPNEIDFESSKLIKLSPVFSDFVESVEKISSSETVDVYEVKQENSTNSKQNSKYKAYDIKDSGFYIDLNKDNLSSVRFEVLSPRVLSTFSYQKEKLGKREYYQHSLISYYVK